MDRLSLRWTFIAGVYDYRTQRSVDNGRSWRPIELITSGSAWGASETPVGGIVPAVCNESNIYQVAGYGDGDPYARKQGAWSVRSDAITPSCVTTVRFSGTSSVRAGIRATIGVSLGRPSNRSLTIPVTVTNVSAEPEDYSISGLNSGSLTFSIGDRGKSFYVNTKEDVDCDHETLRFSFGDMPIGVSEGTPSSLTLQITDNRCGPSPTPTPTHTPPPIPIPTVSFSPSRYSVDEGSTENIYVRLSHSLSSTVTIPITVSGGLPDTSVTFNSGVTSISFPVMAGQDSDCDDETVNLGFGTLPAGIGLGTPETATVSIDDDEICPTPTPTPTPDPCPSPCDSPPPIDREPTFGSRTVAPQRYQKGDEVRVQLPAARGGNGTRRYTITPSIGNGLRFDSLTRSIIGTPRNAARTTLYTYTVTDEDGDTASLRITVTVFDASVTVENGNLEDIHWGVLGYKEARIIDPLHRAETYQFRVGIPAGTGFQLDSECVWPVEPPTSTATLWSNWVLLGSGTFDLVRCGLGSGGTVSIRMQVRIQGESGQGSGLSITDVTILHSWHRDDHRVDYYILGSTATGVQGVSTPGSHGLFPSIRPSHLSGSPPDFASARFPGDPLLDVANYAAAAKAWNDVNAGATITQSSRAARADVVIRGYWDADPGGPRETDSGNNIVLFVDPKCDTSIACTHPAGTYPHIGSPQLFWIEDPPHWGDEENAREWTSNFNHWLGAQRDYQYLPKTLMHEFGHTLGLGHSPSNDVMSGGVSICNNAFCGLTDADRRGAKAIYEHHTNH